MCTHGGGFVQHWIVIQNKGFYKSFNLKSFFLCELAHRNVSTFCQNEKKTGFEGGKIVGFGWILRASVYKSSP